MASVSHISNCCGCLFCCLTVAVQTLRPLLELGLSLKGIHAFFLIQSWSPFLHGICPVAPVCFPGSCKPCCAALGCSFSHSLSLLWRSAISASMIHVFCFQPTFPSWSLGATAGGLYWEHRNTISLILLDCSRSFRPASSPNNGMETVNYESLPLA